MEPILNFFIQAWYFIVMNIALCVLIAWSLLLAVTVTVLLYKNRNLKWRKCILEDYCDECEGVIEGLGEQVTDYANELLVANKSA